MMRSDSAVRWLFASACALLAASCESTTQVGSECRHGVCPRASLVSSRACVASSTWAEISVTRAIDDNPPGLGSICLPRPLPTDSQGRVDCRVVWVLNEVDLGELPDGAAPPLELEQCSDLPFLTPAGSGDPPNACVVRQLTADEVAGGEADGWYYADETTDHCLHDGPAVTFTEGAAPQTGTTVKVACSRVQAIEADGQRVDVDPSECGAPPENGSGDGVGDACMPAAPPENGYSDQEAHVETRSADCDTGTCLVYHLRGHADPECNPDRDAGVFCATEDAVQNHVYCSCRCDVPPGDPGEPCECADGFTCLPVLEDGPPGVRGSYCVRNGTFTEP